MSQQKPTGVTVIAVLFFIAGGLGVLSSIMVLTSRTLSFLGTLASVIVTYQVLIGLGQFIFGALAIVVGWGLLTLQSWARITGLILIGLSAIGSLFAGVGLLMGVNLDGFTLNLPGPGVANLILAGIDAWFIWYLLKPDVEAAFGTGTTLPPWQPTTVPPVTPPTTVSVAQPTPPTSPVRPPRQSTIPIGRTAAPEGWLVLRNGPRRGQQFGLGRGRNTVGRDPNRADILINQETVSGEHARVQFASGQFYITDLASTNGTFVNNRRIQKQLLMDNDVVRFGNAETVFKRVT